MQSIAEIDPLSIVELGRTSPDTLLAWVYDNLGKPSSESLDPDWSEALLRGARASTGYRIDPEFSYALQLCRYPVSIEEFLFGSGYLNKTKEEIYPAVLHELRQINNPLGLRIVNPYTEFLGTGGIGSAKSTTALYTVAYQLYVLSCFESPHETFGLDRSSEIVFVFQSMGGQVASVDYTRFYEMLKDSPYFNTVFPYKARLSSEMHFPHRVQVKPIGVDAGTIGQNVMGGLIDELNFMAVIKNSKRSIDGGEYNQALTIYNSISRRRKSRFLGGNKMPGILCLVSSKRYPGEFTDMKLAEARTDPSIYVYDKRVWDIKPAGTYSTKTFLVFKGDVSRKAEIADGDFYFESVDKDLLIEVPIDFYKDFQDDIIGSLRDIAGVSTLARYPFIQNANSVSSAFGGVQSLLNVEETDMETVRLEFFPSRFENLEHPRWVHVDLGVTSDACGVACGYVPEFKETNEGTGPLPVIRFDFVLRVVPPRGGEIAFHKVRRLITSLRDSGLPIRWVSFDSFQSVDSIQILRQAGFATGRQSLDLNSAPYVFAKSAFYTGRVLSPSHEHCVKEFISLERDKKTGKIDHPPTGSKDCSDAAAGVIYGLTLRREVWAEHGVPFNQVFSQARETKVKEEANV